jgi:hypothetical protein
MIFDPIARGTLRDRSDRGGSIRQRGLGKLRLKDRMSTGYNQARLVLSSWASSVRASLHTLLALVLAATVACVGVVADSVEDDGNSPSAEALLCFVDDDCVPAGATCCECPTFAVTRRDPISRACSNVECPKDGCAENVTARCNGDNRCELVCKPLACAQGGPPCQYGYAIAENGCLTCECAVPLVNGCAGDADCVQTRADCCGCQQGGKDTAVLASEKAAFDASLMCAPEPACPGINVCTFDEPTCVQGRCDLVSRDLPAGACGRADLPQCAPGEVCLVNVSDQANMHGVGVCGAPP